MKSSFTSHVFIGPKISSHVWSHRVSLSTEGSSSGADLLNAKPLSHLDLVAKIWRKTWGFSWIFMDFLRSKLLEKLILMDSPDIHDIMVSPSRKIPGGWYLCRNSTRGMVRVVGNKPPTDHSLKRLQWNKVWDSVGHHTIILQVGIELHPTSPAPVPFHWSQDVKIRFCLHFRWWSPHVWHVWWLPMTDGKTWFFHAIHETLWPAHAKNSAKHFFFASLGEKISQQQLLLLGVWTMNIHLRRMCPSRKSNRKNNVK